MSRTGTEEAGKDNRRFPAQFIAVLGVIGVLFGLYWASRYSYLLFHNLVKLSSVDFVEFSEAVKQLGLYWLLLNEPPPR